MNYKRFVPFPSSEMLPGQSYGASSCRVLMAAGEWKVPPEQRPTVAPAPRVLSKSEKIAYGELRRLHMDKRTIGLPPKSSKSRVGLATRYHPK
jgi:hypothetical protein